VLCALRVSRSKEEANNRKCTQKCGSLDPMIGVVKPGCGVQTIRHRGSEMKDSGKTRAKFIHNVGRAHSNKKGEDGLFFFLVCIACTTVPCLHLRERVTCKWQAKSQVRKKVQPPPTFCFKRRIQGQRGIKLLFFAPLLLFFYLLCNPWKGTGNEEKRNH
jgi:hypothetical protein